MCASVHVCMYAVHVCMCVYVHACTCTYHAHVHVMCMSCACACMGAHKRGDNKPTNILETVLQALPIQRKPGGMSKAVDCHEIVMTRPDQVDGSPDGPNRCRLTWRDHLSRPESRTSTPLCVLRVACCMRRRCQGAQQPECAGERPPCNSPDRCSSLISLTNREPVPLGRCPQHVRGS